MCDVIYLSGSAGRNMGQEIVPLDGELTFLALEPSAVHDVIVTPTSCNGRQRGSTRDTASNIA